MSALCVQHSRGEVLFLGMTCLQQLAAAIVAALVAAVHAAAWRASGTSDRRTGFQLKQEALMSHCDLARWRRQ